MSRWRPIALGVLAVAVAGGCSDDARLPSPSSLAGSWPDGVEPPVVEIVIDVEQALLGGRIPVEITAIGGRPTHFSRQSEWADGYRFHDVQFADEAGRPLLHDESEGRYRPQGGPHPSLGLSYTVELGGEGRHGSQGVVAPDHVMFDGRLFLLPEGAEPLRSARLRFTVPAGWTVASPFRKEGDWYYVDQFRPELTAKSLGGSCLAAGLFELETRRIGEMEVRVAGHTSWSPDHRRRLAEKTFRMLEYYREVLGFDLAAPYSVVWVPAPDGGRVFGGSYANGTCFEHPVERERNWELLGHRVAHAMNNYRPSGMLIEDRRDAWFTEGWASYMEFISTRDAGLSAATERWERLYRRYRGVVAGASERDMPLAEEPTADDAAREFLHYVKGPLVVRMLAREVQARSGKTLEPFMAEMWQRYGWFRRPLPLRAELEAYAGASLDDFWEAMVDRKGRVELD